MRAWRKRLNRRQAGLKSRYGARHKLSQAEVAHLVGSSAVWYGMLERGQRDQGYSEEFLDRVAVVLRLTFHERIVLFRLAAGREPAPRPLVGMPEIDVATMQMVQQVRSPSWCATAAGDVLAHNDAAANWLPGFVDSQPRNFALWVCTSPDARRQLVDWERSWAAPAVAQLRAAMAERPEDQRVREVLATVLSACSGLWKEWSTAPQVRVHPGHAIRHLVIPEQAGRIGVHHLCMRLTANPGVQLYVLLPHSGQPLGWGHLPPPLQAFPSPTACASPM
jgi:hypothetical protein